MFFKPKGHVNRKSVACPKSQSSTVFVLYQLLSMVPPLHSDNVALVGSVQRVCENLVAQLRHPDSCGRSRVRGAVQLRSWQDSLENGKTM